MSNLHICFSSDDRYAPYCGVAVASILMHANPVDDLFFYILDGGITPDNKTKFEQLKKIRPFEIHFVEVSAEDFRDCPIRHGDHVSLETYYRLKIPDLFPDLEKILYLDCDILVTGDLGPLYRENLDEYAAAMVPDLNREEDASRLGLEGPLSYCNAGVMLLNCKEWREEQLGRRLFEYIAENANALTLWDQDAINIILRGKIKELNERWNLVFELVYTQSELDRAMYKERNFQKAKIQAIKIKDASILHFVSCAKPWTGRAIHPITKKYIQCLKQTPWYQPWRMLKIRIVACLRIARRWLRLHGF